jgi:hypothetical protein
MKAASDTAPTALATKSPKAILGDELQAQGLSYVVFAFVPVDPAQEWSFESNTT